MAFPPSFQITTLMSPPPPPITGLYHATQLPPTRQTSILPPPPPSLPSKPKTESRPSSNVMTANAVISAEPELRDLRKETTNFVPTSIRRKKVGGGPKVNASPSVGEEEKEEEEKTSSVGRADLLKTLKLGGFGGK